MQVLIAVFAVAAAKKDVKRLTTGLLATVSSSLSHSEPVDVLEVNRKLKRGKFRERSCGRSFEQTFRKRAHIF